MAAARVFLSKHRLEPSLNVSDRGIRLDLDSDSESEDGVCPSPGGVFHSSQKKKTEPLGFHHHKNNG